ncbi:protocatechuate 3,4-dioxygenase subunit alpha [Xylophilus ampelinus]|uniref:Protocatechuate 3,4-dioxygenase alpha subunit n=1 Tax=Xylophilus ampelinus TaxID=54067 RepID=A0A318SJI3_9BURK|nr:protocatechuate 3,4-dioxygenase alpha subunit [Xylophilus ampelinus]
MHEHLMSALRENFGQTPSQTVGPYFAYGLTAAQYQYDFDQPFDAVVASAHAEGEQILLEGVVYDGDGQPIADAMIEIQQADAQGRYAQASEAPRTTSRQNGFRGFGRCGTGTDPQHRYVFQTLKPGAHSPAEAPHINLIVLMRGMPLHAFTRVYFSDEAQANARDAVLAAVPAERRPTLVAQRTDAHGRIVYRFDIHMQGPKETVFFDV